VFLFQLTRFKHWLMHWPTDAEWAHVCRALAGMQWPAHLSYEEGKAVAVQFSDCGFAQPSLCLLPDEPTTRFIVRTPRGSQRPGA
jgi:hypothetical protein